MLHCRGCTEEFDHGTISVTSFAEGYVEDRTAGDWIGLIFPHDTCPGLTARLDALSSSALAPSGAVALLAGFTVSLSLRLPAATEDQARAFAEMTRAMLAGCIPAGSDQSRGKDGAGDLVKRAKVERVIRRNIGSARLDVERICAFAAVFRSVVYWMFESEGGIAIYVRRLRLRLVAEDLANPGLADQTIASLAEQRGFHCAASFSRGFKEAFVHSPREAREAVALGFRHAAPKRRNLDHQIAGTATPSLMEILH